jgi:hypothetical protein
VSIYLCKINPILLSHKAELAIYVTRERVSDNKVDDKEVEAHYALMLFCFLQTSTSEPGNLDRLMPASTEYIAGNLTDHGMDGGASGSMSE